MIVGICTMLHSSPEDGLCCTHRTQLVPVLACADRLTALHRRSRCAALEEHLTAQASEHEFLERQMTMELVSRAVWVQGCGTRGRWLCA